VEVSAPQEHDLDAKLLKARVKATLFGRAEPVRIGRFELTRRCGEGGEGVVYEAFDPRLGRRVALKCLHTGQVTRGASLQREFRALARLVHPNLALLYELFCIDGRWFHSMELLSGVDFLAYVRAGRRLHEERLRDAFAQLLHGLAAIHGAGKVHRDLKPNNVLVEPDGRVVIVDYGLMVERPSALAVPAARAEWERAGTLAYMAPEQIRRGGVHAAADMYAVGVMLFEALTGARPDAPQATPPRPGAHHEDRRPSRYAAGVPRDLDLLCEALLAHEPTRRPSAREALARSASTASPASVVDAISPAVADECFVGRAAQLHALHAAYARAHGGRAMLALVHGESGMGKSALLAQFSRELSSLATRPLLWVAQCYERENTPYKMFDGVIESLVDHLAVLPEKTALAYLAPEAEALAQIFPAFRRLSALCSVSTAPSPTDRTELRRRAFAAVRALFRRLRAHTTIVLCIDDLQWGDVDSIRLLQELLSAPDAPALLLVAAYRRSEVASSPLLHEALGRGALYGLDCEVLEVAVDALDMADARELMRQAHAARGTRVGSRAALDQHIRAASGIPFLLRELAEQEAGPGASQDGSVTSEVVVGRHKARCSTAAQALLDVLCIAGRPLEMSLALRAGDVGSDAWKAASELCATRLARWRDTHGERCLEPYHDLIRQEVVARADRDQVRRVHASIVRDMETLAMDEPAHLVHHLIAAGESERAGDVAIEAAQRAAHKLAWDSAAELLGLALDLLPASHTAQLSLHAQHGEALALAGRHRAAAAAYQRAAALAPVAAAAQHARNAAQQLMRAGDVQPATALLQKLLHDVGLRYPHNEAGALLTYARGLLRRSFRDLPNPSPQRERPALEAQRLATLATVYAELWLVDPVRALAIHTWFFEEACRSRDRYRLQALTWETCHLAIVQGPSARPRLTQLLTEIDRQAEHGAAYDRAVAQLARAMYLIHVERRPRDALPRIDEADRILTGECSGTHFERCWLLLMRDHVQEASGDFAALSEAVLPYERGEYEDGYTLQRLLISLPIVRLAQDQPREALRFLQTRWQRSKRRANISDFIAIMRLASVQLYQGDAHTSFETLRAHWLWLRSCGMFRSAPMRELADFHRARSAAALYLRSGDPRWRKEARRREWRVFERSFPETRGLTCLIEASLARADARFDACRALLLEAREDFERGQNDSAYWVVQYRLAQVNEAPAALREALEWMYRHGVREPERWSALFMP
jgi:hypothetical protein